MFYFRSCWSVAGRMFREWSMSNHLISLAYKADVGSLLRKSVLVLLADKASDDGSGVWASKQTMADELCCSKQSIINTMRQFVAERLIRETGKRDHQNGYTVEYQIEVAALETLPKVLRWRDQSKTFTSQGRLPLNRIDQGSQSALPKPSRTPRSKKDKPSSRTRAKPKISLPENWQPKPLTADTVCAQIVAAWQSGRIERELSKFRDHHLKGDTQWSDWDAAWRTWIQRAGDFEGSGNGTQHQPSLRGSRPDPALDLLRAARAAEAAERSDGQDHRGTRPPLQAIGRC